MSLWNNLSKTPFQNAQQSHFCVSTSGSWLYSSWFQSYLTDIYQRFCRLGHVELQPVFAAPAGGPTPCGSNRQIFMTASSMRSLPLHSSSLRAASGTNCNSLPDSSSPDGLSADAGQRRKTPIHQIRATNEQIKIWITFRTNVQHG